MGDTVYLVPTEKVGYVKEAIRKHGEGPFEVTAVLGAGAFLLGEGGRYITGTGSIGTCFPFEHLRVARS